ncbi:MAG: 2-C-methyl-D-erythritol 4-phosphate cytidylyltransferase [Eubacteriales bacterium]|nr:2-C-methyl-D-erythritol 4-phosphate cytidylyltransferase [Eubacterium sp.]MDD7180299.1 2-C-methyl-D-erythritol 4-phosphate cytidylyltransferase [Eubacterium sp.]MDY5492967.1 2-C-methyl-D-erythritol 4-phosphate cytidylyltransferase [Eubacteriales bacterium]CDE19389.1 2-C-methyl-D-erythritol 4-phosphate cytidylyltransferase [Eubacterium sp. CAG:841]
MNVFKKIARALTSKAARECKRYYTSAIIVAAGKSTRTSGAVPKQLVPINGIPVVVRTMLSFEKCALINEIIVVAAKGQLKEYENFKRQYNITKLSAVTAGGNTRSDSVLAGFGAVSPKCEFVAIHDGARCLIKSEDIEKVIKSAFRYGSAIAASKSTDTLKKVNENGIISETVNRDTVMRAQTPQVFMKDIYEIAISSKTKPSSPTDDSMLVESAGFKVHTVEAGAYNIKITTDEDFYVAERIISNGELV